ncbi:MAG: PepSY-associated TM helix domain-containing protein [Ferruginibacter sp.]
MKKKGLFYIHSVAGLISGIFILILSISGSLLVFHEELDELQQPTVQAVSGKEIISVDSCYHILQQKYPHAMISNCDIAENITMPFRFSMYDPSYKVGKAPMQVFLHPQTGSVLKTRGGSEDVKNNFMSWLAAFHSSFHLGKTGEWLLVFFSVLFIISLLTGLIIYRKNIPATLLFRKSAWRKKNFHQVIGTWALLFNLMIAITGFWMQRYVFKNDFYSDSSWEMKLKASPDLSFNVNAAFIKMHEQFPDFTAAVIYFPQSKSGKMSVYGSNKTNSFIHNKKFADVIFIDSSGAACETRFVNSIPAADRYDIINSQIHFGKYGGWPVKIIYSLLGLTGGILSITGFILWRKRRKSF